jgi:DegV family protein with EDD domain
MGVETERIAIVAGTSTSIPRSEAEKLGLFYFPYHITVKTTGEQFTDFTIPSEELYAIQKRGGDLITSQPNPEEMANIYRDIHNNYGIKKIVSIHVSDALSGTYGSACIAAKIVKKEFGDDIDIEVIDTRSLCYGEKSEVLRAKRMIDEEGKTFDEVVEALRQPKRDIVLYASGTRNTLHFVDQGGRVDGVKEVLVKIGARFNFAPILYSTNKSGKLEMVPTFPPIRLAKDARKRTAAIVKKDIDRKGLPSEIGFVYTQDINAGEDLRDSTFAQVPQLRDVYSLGFGEAGLVLGAQIGAGVSAVAVVWDNKNL